MGDITPDVEMHTPSGKSGASATGGFSTTPTLSDPYTYQVGFGGRFASEAM